MFRLAVLLLVISGVLFSSNNSVLKKIESGCPQWMREQIDEDLAPYYTDPISLRACEERYATFIPDHYILRFTIKNNRVSVLNPTDEPGIAYRAAPFIEALKELCRITKMPDVVFYITMHDGVMQPNMFSPHLDDFPIFTMSRLTLEKETQKSILVPDFDALYENYQVLKGKDVRKFEIPWNQKEGKLLWRGSTAQCGSDFSRFPDISSANMSEETAHLFSRYVICQQSQAYPELIDARYTFLADLDKTFPAVLGLQGSWLTYIDQYKYKYHIVIHGNAASYTNSCWKLFSNSAIFIPETYWEQWYYNALKPYEHFIPVQTDLEDLPEKVLWAKTHDQECQRIAYNSRKFALENLTRDDHLVYFYFLLNSYSVVIAE